MENSKTQIQQTQPSTQIAERNTSVLAVFGNMDYIKTAQFLSQSQMIPANFRGKPADILLAFNISNNVGFDPFTVMQNMDVIQGKPSWSSKILIALINSCGRYTSLKYKFGNDPKLGGMTCYAYATEKATGEEIIGPTISMKMAQDEGWLTKNGSKWKTMPEVMIRYRAASFFARLNCPEVLFGMYTSDEQYEISGGDTNGVPSPDGTDYLDLTSQEPATSEPAPAQPETPATNPSQETPEPEMADKKEKMQIFSTAKTLFGDRANDKVKESLKKIGMTNTNVMTRENVKFVLADLKALSAKEKLEEKLDSMKAEPENTEDPAPETTDESATEVPFDISSFDITQPPSLPFEEAV